MDKRYQVFISSTYTDLEDERKKVYQAIMEMDCIPAGMELFPAMDEDQFEFIKKIVDDSDYYILIVGGRYGTSTSDGLSYTEKEYDYAVAKGIKVIALVHGEPQAIPQGRSEATDEGKSKLEKFRQKVSTGRLVRFWTKTDEIPGLVLASLQRTIKTYPAVGWVRANQAGSAELLAQINELRLENERLKIEKSTPRRKRQIAASSLARGEDVISLNYKTPYTQRKGQISLTWDYIFSAMGPHILVGTLYDSARMNLSKILGQLNGFEPGDWPEINHFSFDTVTMQLHSVGYIDFIEQEVAGGESRLLIKITDDGMFHLAKLRTVPKVST